MPNFPGPQVIEISYTCSGVQHKMRLNTHVAGDPAVGEDVANIDLTLRDLTTKNVDTAVTEWINLLKPFFHTTTTFDEYSIWNYVFQTFDRVFVTSAPIGISGTGTGSVTLAQQDTFTFRTQEGGTMKIVLLESAGISKVRETYASLGAPSQAVFDYCTDSDGWILARDTSYPAAPLAKIGGENEALFRKRYR